MKYMDTDINNILRPYYGEPGVSQTVDQLKKRLNAVYGRKQMFGTEQFKPFFKPYDVFLIPKIKKVIFNPPATIVIWSDDSKTIVKCEKDDKFDPEIGLAMAIARKYFGSRHQMVKLVNQNCELTKKRQFKEIGKMFKTMLKPNKE